MDRVIFLWPRKTVSVSVRYLFYQRSKHGLFVFPNACGEGTVRLANRISVWRQSEVSIDFRKVLRGMKFFHPSIRLTNQKPRAFVSFRRTNQIALFRLFVVSVLFACFYFKVRRKSLSKDCKCIYSRCYSFKGATSRYLLSFWERETVSSHQLISKNNGPDQF